ncbi:MAG: HAD family hydrolase [Deltaproteobacteria bacterium]|nr:HAD family hydrolase [Deltaproteobacteria bacterium]
MTIRTAVLDFDGTLVDSNRLKYEAYFAVFPADEATRRVIEAVLAEIFEASRYEILEEIIRRTTGQEGEALKARVAEVAAAYNDLVLAGAETCPEIPGAREALELLAAIGIPVYLSSTTPEEFLRPIVAARGWTGFFREIYGYPRRKEETLAAIIERENLGPGDVLVVGDGESDRRSAAACGTRFLPVRAGRFPLEPLRAVLA